MSFDASSRSPTIAPGPRLAGTPVQFSCSSCMLPEALVSVTLGCGAAAAAHPWPASGGAAALCGGGGGGGGGSLCTTWLPGWCSDASSGIGLNVTLPRESSPMSRGIRWYLGGIITQVGGGRCISTCFFAGRMFSTSPETGKMSVPVQVKRYMTLVYDPEGRRHFRAGTWLHTAACRRRPSLEGHATPWPRKAPSCPAGPAPPTQSLRRSTARSQAGLGPLAQTWCC